jgi:hypothetical protein
MQLNPAIFQDPDLVGSAEYAAIYDALQTYLDNGHEATPEEASAMVVAMVAVVAETEDAAHTTSAAVELPDVIDVEEIDRLLDEGVPEAALVGKSLRWHDESLCALRFTRSGRLVAELVLPCARCGEDPQVALIGSGLHSGAWCYVYDEDGAYVGNLRDQEYICATCQDRRRA